MATLQEATAHGPETWVADGTGERFTGPGATFAADGTRTPGPAETAAREAEADYLAGLNASSEADTAAADKEASDLAAYEEWKANREAATTAGPNPPEPMPEPEPVADTADPGEASEIAAYETWKGAQHPPAGSTVD